MVLSNGNVMVIGGQDATSDMLASCEIYNVSAESWSYTESLNFPRTGSKAIMLDNGNVLISGGTGGVQTCELYDQNTGMWTETGSLNQWRGSLFDITKLANGNVLITGGGNNVAEIYNVASSTWSEVPNNMMMYREGGTAVLMSNGKVLVTGGNQTKSSEIYDPVSNDFHAAGDMIWYATRCDMINLSNGKVLIHGIGNIITITDKESLQVFDPVTETWSLAGTVPLSINTANRYTVHKLQSGAILYIGGNWTTGNGANQQCYLVDEDQITGIAIYSVHTDFELYPNPAVNEITVQSNLRECRYKLTDIAGKTVLNGFSSNNSFQLDVTDLSSNIYVLELRNGSHILKAKVVKE